MSPTPSLREDAARLLREGRVKLVIGYRAHAGGGQGPAVPEGACRAPLAGGGGRRPAFIEEAHRAGELVFDGACSQNLAAYLKKPEVRARMPLAIVASEAVGRSLVSLAAESQFAQGALLALAFRGERYEGVKEVEELAALAREAAPEPRRDPDIGRRLAELAAWPAQRRAEWWSARFSRCTRCYACRAACPGCYCQRCVTERNVPQWVSTAALGHGNYAWNMIRAFHQAGRCTLCGACASACPQGLPLMLLNTFLAAQAAEQFDVEAGLDPAAKPLIGTWDPEDDNSFFT
ncbi:MAG: 4Fe-4S dicluster domain-containing protein [Elusimicrobia bacterium]|nr:4Fe-4S dicluster domain-containing protein [Elusimicrobiota bacterium]